MPPRPTDCAGGFYSESIPRNSAPLPDLATRDSIHDLVVRFYRDVAADDLLGPVFEDIARVDWAEHVPKLTDYWCRVLLGHPGYDGTILGPHRGVHDHEPLTPAMFDRWYGLFADTVDGRWDGLNATRAKDHAARIAGMLSRIVTGADWVPTATGAPEVGGGDG